MLFVLNLGQTKRDALVTVSKQPVLPARDVQELWFATRRRDWNTLVVVPGSPGSSTTLRVAQALGDVGGLLRMAPTQVIDAQGMDLSAIASLVMEMTDQPQSSVWSSGSSRGNGVPGGWEPQTLIRRGQPVIIAIDSVVENPLVLPVALAADAVLLCIEIGHTDLAAARHSVALMGHECLIGTAVLRR